MTRTVPMAAAAWLFTRGELSLRLLRPGECVVMVNGPGAHRSTHTFNDELLASSFILGIEQALLASGWMSQGMQHDRRVGDRRRHLRIVPGRRRTDAAASSPVSDA